MIDKIFIQPPCYRTILVGNDKFFLPFPYIIFKSRLDVGCNDLFVTFSKNVPKKNTMQYLVPLGNMVTDAICLGKDNFSTHKSIIDRFWNSKFSKKVVWNIPDDDRITTNYKIDYNKWQKLSLEEIVTIKWAKFRKLNNYSSRLLPIQEVSKQ